MTSVMANIISSTAVCSMGIVTFFSGEFFGLRACAKSSSGSLMARSRCENILPLGQQRNKYSIYQTRKPQRPKWKICNKLKYPYLCVCVVAVVIHYNDFIMSAVACQIIGVSIVYLTVSSGADQRKHQSSASWAFVRGIHRWPWIPREKS